MRNSKETGIIAIVTTLFRKVVPQEIVSNEAFQKEATFLCKLTSNKERLCSTVIHNNARLFALASLAILFLAILPVVYAISEEITLQGKLTHSNGQALSGDYTFLFELFDSNSGGTALWTETHGLTVTNGVFAANLGSNNSTQYLTTSDFNAERWVQITVDGSTQVPRVKLNSQPSAFIAKKAMGLDLNAFMNFSDFNSWYASAFNPTFSGDSNFTNIGVSGQIYGENIAGDLNIGTDVYIEGNQTIIGNVGIGTLPKTNYGIEMDHASATTTVVGLHGEARNNFKNANAQRADGLYFGAVYNPIGQTSNRIITSLNGAFITSAIANEVGETSRATATWARGVETKLFSTKNGTGDVTIVDGANYYARDGTLVGGGTITNLYGFYDEGMTTGGSNWGFYGLSVDNYLAGNLEIGNGVDVSGDSNFVNVGVSDNIYVINTVVGDKFKNSSCDASGADAVALGTETIASGDGSFASGIRFISGATEASGDGSFATGYNFRGNITASNWGGFAGGYTDQDGTIRSSGIGSFAFGHYGGSDVLSSGSGSISMGYGTKAFGDGAVALGYDTNATGQGSFASGDGTIASGVGSTAMGDSTIASGDDSFAVGRGGSNLNVISDGIASFAGGMAASTSGGGIVSSGNGAFAYGYINFPTSQIIHAGGNGSFAWGASRGIIEARGGGAMAGGTAPAFGDSIEAIGDGSIALGRSDTNIVAEGDGSVAMGYSSGVSGILRAGDDFSDYGAIALGYNVQSLAEASVTLGKDLTNYNANSVLVQDLNVLGSSADLNIFVISAGGNIGSGTGLSPRDVLYVQGGDGQNSNDGTAGNGSDIDLIAGSGGWDNHHGAGGDAGDVNIIAGWAGSNAGGGGTVGEQGNIYLTTLGARYTGVNSAPYGDVIMLHNGGSLISGVGASATGLDAVAIGKNTTATGNQSIALGYNTQSLATAAVTLGQDLNNYNVNSVLVQDLNVLGDMSLSGSAVVLGSDSNFANIGLTGNIYGDSSTIIQADKFQSIAGVASGDDAVAFGIGVTASGNQSMAMGYYTTASGNYSLAGGTQTQAIGYTSIAMGEATHAYTPGVQGLAANGVGSIAMGSTEWHGLIEANGVGSIAMGHGGGLQLSSSGNGSVSMGYTTKAFGNGAVALGYDTNATGQGSFASGDGTIASGIGSTAIGDSTIASGADSFAAGNGTTASGAQSTAMGLGTTASQSYSLAAGHDTTSSGWASFAFGNNATIENGSIIESSGQGSLAGGYADEAPGPATSIIQATNSGSVALGYTAALGPTAVSRMRSSGIGSIVMGFAGNTGTLESIGSGSVAMGYSDANTTANGTGAIALGYNVQSLGEASFAAGKDTTASGDYSFTTGLDTEAIGTGSFAGGYSMVTAATTIRAIGDGSFAFGNTDRDTTQKGSIYAVGNGSVAMGYADGDAQDANITAIGEGSVAMGYTDSGLLTAGNEYQDKGAIALGYNVQSLAEASVTLGKNLTNYNTNSLLVEDLNVNDDVMIYGDLDAAGTVSAAVKAFKIGHPLDEDKFLIHSAIEGPESAVYYRGEAQLEEGAVTIQLPDYFEELTRKEGRTVLLTARNGWSPLYVDGDVENGQVTVRTTENGNLGQEFYWEVKAVRADVALLETEPLKEQPKEEVEEKLPWGFDRQDAEPVPEQGEELEAKEKPLAETWATEEKQSKEEPTEKPFEEPSIEEEPKEEEPPVEDPPVEEPLAEEPPVEECTVICSSDGECDDADGNTLDVCNNDGECESSCTNLSVVFNARAIWSNLFGLIS